jgi:predicted GH43/DUF377 family glycosyl hydrolase
VTFPSSAPWLTRTPIQLNPDPRRVITRLFVPGQEILADGESRAASVVKRILAMTDCEVTEALASTLAAFSARHRGFSETLEHHFDLVAHRLGARAVLNGERRLLMGAYFTNEYAVEAAALCNPSMVLHPDQSLLEVGEARFVMSLRAVGEGHLSCIEFRTGVVGPGPLVRLDDPGDVLVGGHRRPPLYDRNLFRGKLAELGEDRESAAFVLDSLPERFTPADLDGAVAALDEQILTRNTARQTIERIRWVAASNYDVEFPEDSAIGERVLWPLGPAESHGMEDARFVRFTDDGGGVTYYATYTAFDGSHVAPQLLETGDFRTFRVTQLTGTAARNKGMALFPRLIDGRYAALSRWDRENNAIVTSADCRSWGAAVTLQSPREPWELLQIGNCGSPIETPEGWLVFTHGVGPMRVYSIGAILLDLDDPARVRAQLPHPVILPNEAERDGYVPNVVYSCGALLHADSVVLPYGVSDTAVRIAVIGIDEILDRLLAAVR